MNRVYNLLTVVFLLLTVGMLAFVGIQFSQGPVEDAPTTPLPTAIGDLPTLTATLTPTETLTPRPTLPPTFTPTPSETPTPTPTVPPTPTITDTPVPSATPTITDTPEAADVPAEGENAGGEVPFDQNAPPPGADGAPPGGDTGGELPFGEGGSPPGGAPPGGDAGGDPGAEQPAGPTNTPTDTPFLFDLRPDGTGLVLQSNVTNTLGCNWMGIGGRVLDVNGFDLTTRQFQVRVFGNGIEEVRNTGSFTTFYGLTGWEVQVADAPANLTYLVRLETPQGTQISPDIQVTFPGTCEQNLAVVTFLQTRNFGS